MKKILFCCIILITGISSAQNQDQKSQQILKSVSAKYKSYKSLKALFTITMENGQDKKKDIQKGTLYLKGNKYKLEIAGQDVISDGKTRWTFVKDANEVQIDNQKTDENAISPTNIFTIYEKGWKSTYMGEEKVKGKAVSDLVELIPADPKGKNVFKVKLTISKSDKMITAAKVFTKNGNTQTIALDKLLPDGASDETLFTFVSSKYPGADVVDLR